MCVEKRMIIPNLKPALYSSLKTPNPLVAELAQCVGDRIWTVRTVSGN